MDHGITTQLIIHVGPNSNEFFEFYCIDDECFGWPTPHYAVFLEELDCQKILPKAKKFHELPEPVNKHLQLIANDPKTQP